MSDLAAALCLIAVIISLIAFASMCIAIMLWLIGLFGVGFEAVCRSFVVMTISVIVFTAAEMMIDDI